MNNNNVITTNTLKQEAPFVLPPTIKDATPYQSIIDGAITSLPSINTTLSEAQNNQNNLLNTLSTRINEVSGKTQYQQEQEQLAGVNTEQANIDNLTTQLNDITASMTALKNESLAIPLKIQNEAIGQGVTDAGVAPIQTARLRENAIKSLTLSSNADALLANLTNSDMRLQRAKEKAKMAVDLKYKPKEDEIARIKDILELNQKYIIDPQEKKQAEKTSIALAERQRILEEQKVNEIKSADMLVNANTQGAPASAISLAQKMIAEKRPYSEVAVALGKYAGDYYKTELLKAQLQTEKLQQQKIRQDMSIKADTVNYAGKPVKVTPTEIQNLNEAGIAKDSFKSLITQFRNNINNTGTYEMFGTEAGAKDTLNTNLLLAMKSLEKTGALDAGTINVLSGTIPSNQFFATKANQLEKLRILEETVIGKADAYINSYRGTTAETDPRVSRYYPKQTAEQTAGKNLMQSMANVNAQMIMPTNTSTASQIYNTLYGTKK